ncbi:hypothetical protein, conserved [Leishmania tarentolae]|uniref:Uncharacterized protein n=1 Tax=Leishmania tarentolae TaxID=5689 RepID=A0A640KVL9_LEITA|nr:hypothetical protein, conserved [Leishmania tarentolae]
MPARRQKMTVPPVLLSTSLQQKREGVGNRCMQALRDPNVHALAYTEQSLLHLLRSLPLLLMAFLNSLCFACVSFCIPSAESVVRAHGGGTHAHRGVSASGSHFCLVAAAMTNTSSAASDELRRTQQYLVEVIDECVFVERQRELTELRLSSRLETQKDLVNDLVAVLHDVCRYMSTMEDVILLPTLLQTLPASSPAHHKLLQLRNQVRDALSRLRQGRSEDGEDSDLFPVALQRYSGSRAAEIPIISLDNTVEAGAVVMQRLLKHEARFLDALARATSRIDAMRGATTTEDRELEALRARMNEATHVVNSDTSRCFKTSPEVDAPQAQQGVSPDAARFAEARLLAYEKTVQTLNSELALLHENYAALSRARTREVNMLKKHMDDNQHRHEGQIAECDAVLGRMSLELEQLIQENAQLMRKLRMAAEPD